jgi:hypothetical protein
LGRGLKHLTGVMVGGKGWKALLQKGESENGKKS